MNNIALRMATKAELKKQVILPAILYVAGAWMILEYSVTIWLSILCIELGSGFILIRYVRKGIWVPLWRAAWLLITMGVMGLSLLLLLAQSELFSDFTIGFLGVAFVIFSACILAAIAYCYLCIIPYWHECYELNISRRKIDLENATFSVTTRWAIKDSAIKNQYIYWITGFLIFPLVFLVILSGKLDLLVVSIVSVIVLWLGLSMSLIEFYNAYQIRKIEKAIGQPLIIDAYL